jgi:hypothetical protein
MTQYQCDNCEFTHAKTSFNPASDLAQRLDNGGAYTDLECPLCRTLAYPLDACQATTTPLANIATSDDLSEASRFVQAILKTTLDINLTEKKKQKLIEVTLQLAGYANGAQQFQAQAHTRANDDFATALLNHGIKGNASAPDRPYHYGLQSGRHPCHLDTRREPVRFATEYAWHRDSARNVAHDIVIVAVHAKNTETAERLVEGFAQLGIQVDRHFYIDRDQFYSEAEEPYVELARGPLIPNPGWTDKPLYQWPFWAGKQTPVGTPNPYPENSYQAWMFNEGQTTPRQ